MFCPYCGIEIVNDAVFCHSCGKRINPDNNLTAINTESVRIENASEAEKYEEAIGGILKVLPELNILIKKEKEYVGEIKKGILGDYAIALFLGLFFGVTIGFFLFNMIRPWVGTSVGVIITAVMTYLIALAIRGNTIKKNNKFAEAAKEAHDDYVKLLEDNNELMNMVPDDYMYPMALEYMQKLFHDKRVFTINDALKMYDEQEHRWILEENSRAALEQHKIQTKQLKGIRRSSAVSAYANLVNKNLNLARTIGRLWD